MIAQRTILDHADHDKVMNWLQNRELKDRKLGAARSRFARAVDIATAIDRIGDVLHQEFPHIDREALGSLVREYVDPFDRAQVAP